MGRHKPVFNPDQEKELVEYVLLMESRLFGVTLAELRSLAYELAERNNLQHNFNTMKKMAGKCWLYSFLKRNPQLRLRSPEPTSLARAIGFNRTAVKMFFDLLTGLYEQHSFTADRVYNVDETGIKTVPNKQPKVLALRGKRQVGGLVSGERGTLVTAETCMSASGKYMPTMFVFPRQRAKPELLDDTPPGTTAEYHPSGWMQKELFLKWLVLFIEFSKPTKEKPVLLLLDGHATHTKSIEVIEMARNNHVVLLCFPPHCTHRMQPLDVSFMAPLSHYYSEEARKWLQCHPGRPITINQVGKLFGAAFMKAASMETAVNAFKKTGIFPLDPNVFPDWMFQPAETTERPLEETIHQHCLAASSTCQPPVEPILPEFEPTPRLTEPTASLPEPEPNAVLCESHRPISQCSMGSEPSTSTAESAFAVSPKDIKQIPRAQRKVETKNNRRRGKTVILTSSPYKNELIAANSKTSAHSSMSIPKTAKKKNNLIY